MILPFTCGATASMSKVLAYLKFAGVIHVVNAGWFKVYLLKSCIGEPGAAHRSAEALCHRG